MRYWATEVVAGSLSPYEGASRIWWSGWVELERPEELTVFVFLVSEWEGPKAGCGPRRRRAIVPAIAIRPQEVSPHERNVRNGRSLPVHERATALVAAGSAATHDAKGDSDERFPLLDPALRLQPIHDRPGPEAGLR